MQTESGEDYPEYEEYSDDQYDEPTENSQHFNAYEYEDESESKSGSSFVYQNRGKRYHSTTKSTDKAFHTVRRNIGNEIVQISYYQTGFTPGTMIRDAITGIHDPSCRVGKADEYLYFKVCMSTGEGSRGKYGEVEPHYLYYDSPESYERHFCSKLDAYAKSRWTERARKQRQHYQSLIDEKERRISVQVK